MRLVRGGAESAHHGVTGLGLGIGRCQNGPSEDFKLSLRLARPPTFETCPTNPSCPTVRSRHFITQPMRKPQPELEEFK